MSRRNDFKSIDLKRYFGKKIEIKFLDGRQIVGTLTGFDKVFNIVLEEASEYSQDPSNFFQVTDKLVYLGLVVCKSSSICVIFPSEGTEEIANPFEKK
ncbi:u6 snRNA-associated sm-like protein lsm7 [Anaeramoeba ignava]|uniref:U6 snRNA-associated sm-like protein lsm7 n=1 Tax=Anaeramoeba ignava TaxID=1746090 RepID=A0A9Q0LE70_ANAIG|nr:u6 snRNA-associated sm-like protein lsm7 [Anaeramoeba ignava]